MRPGSCGGICLTQPADTNGLARTAPAAASVRPKVVVRDEIAQGTLVEYMTLPNIYENFYAVTVRRHYVPGLLGELLKASAGAEAEAKT